MLFCQSFQLLEQGLQHKISCIFLIIFMYFSRDFNSYLRVDKEKWESKLGEYIDQIIILRENENDGLGGRLIQYNGFKCKQWLPVSLGSGSAGSEANFLQEESHGSGYLKKFADLILTKIYLQ